MLRPIPRQSLSDAVFEQLRDAILGGSLPAGGPLPAERVLCERLGVNRGAVREALRRLEQARLVSVRHGGTSQVLDFRRSAGLDLLGALLVGPGGVLDAEAVRSVMEVRSTLAPEIARLSALRRDDASVEALDETVASMRAAGGDALRLQRLGIRFWNVVVEGSRNLAYGLLWNTLRDTYERLLPLLTEVLAEENGDPEAFAALADAVRRCDGAAAHGLARDLVVRGEQAVSRALGALAAAEAGKRP